MEAFGNAHGKVHWRLQANVEELGGNLACADNVVDGYFGALMVFLSAKAGPK
jgi:hypothetical protein